MTTLQTHQTGRVLVARYDNPPSNYITPGFIRDLDRLTRQVDADGSIGAVILTGAADGRFIAHADPDALRDMSVATPRLPRPVLRAGVRMLDLAFAVPGMNEAAERFGGTAGVGTAWAQRWRRTITRMNRSGTVYLAAINGPALGGGFEIALSCDLRYIADDERIVVGNIEVLAGLSPGGGGSQRLPRMVGTAGALELLLDGRPRTVAEAARAGLVDAVVPPDELAERTLAVGRLLAARSSEAVRAIKHAVYIGAGRPLTDGLRVEAAEFLRTAATAKARRGLDALVDDSARLGGSPFVAAPQAWIDGSRYRRHGWVTTDPAGAQSAGAAG